MFIEGPLIFIISLLFLYLLCPPHHSFNFFDTKLKKKKKRPHCCLRNSLGITKMCTVLSELHQKYKLFFNCQCLEYSLLVAFMELYETRRHYLENLNLSQELLSQRHKSGNRPCSFLFFPPYSAVTFSHLACLEPPFSYQSLTAFQKSPQSIHILLCWQASRGHEDTEQTCSRIKMLDLRA